MRLALLNTFDSRGGASRACLRLGLGLANAGADVRLLVREQGGAEAVVSVVGSRRGGRLRALLDGLPLHLYPDRLRHNFSPAWVPGRGIETAASLRPDLIHLHWVVEGFVQIEALRGSRCPLVWTLHDSWPFTGGCHLPGDCHRYEESCGHCPVLGSAREQDLSRIIWSRKKNAWKDINLTVVAPSRWLADCARTSSLLASRRVEVIPNGVDVRTYCPGDTVAARGALGLPLHKKLILFGALHSLSDPNKGLDLLVAALAKLGPYQEKNFELVVFGDHIDLKVPDCGLPVRNLGIVTDEARIALFYQAADLFVAPSLQENLPNMVLEAMACGTPCVAFDIGGLPELIEHERTGYLARPFDAQDLCHGISWVLADETRRLSLGRFAREKIVIGFALERVTGRYLELYRELVFGREG